MLARFFVRLAGPASLAVQRHPCPRQLSHRAAAAISATASELRPAATPPPPPPQRPAADPPLVLPGALGIAAPATEEAACSRTGAFQRLPMVSPAKELLDSALRRAARVQPNRKLRNEAQKAKNRCC